MKLRKDQRMVFPDSDSQQSKKKQVAEMFDGIAGRYDFLNHFLSFNIDKSWRRKAIREIMRQGPQHILDVATGTGDMAIAAVKAGAGRVTGVDISEGMLEVGRKKLEALQMKDKIQLQSGDSEALSFPDNHFDAAMCAYGVRNFENLEQGLREIFRVLKPGGRLIILEFSHPRRFPIRQLYGFYSRYMLPLLGRLISRHSRAYTYLPESVAAFPEYQQFAEILTGCGFRHARARPLAFGITTLFSCIKPGDVE